VLDAPLNDELRAVFFMLYAFAIENLLKALLVASLSARTRNSLSAA
jgi:hypothetical protein